jgi:primosomal protein N'
VSLINVVIKAPSLETAMRDALDLATRVRRESPGKVLGPAPAALARIKDDYRAQFFIKGTRRGHMREALQTALRSRPDLRRRAVVDVDPVMVV